MHTYHASTNVRRNANFIPKEDLPANSCDVNPLETISVDYRRRGNIQRSSPQNTGRAKTVTTPHLEECDFGHALGAHTFYTSPLRKCQKTVQEDILVTNILVIQCKMNNE